jgi:hypothetical protein
VNETKEFLTALFGDAPEGYKIALWTLPDKRTYLADTADEAINIVSGLKNKDVYVRVTMIQDRDYGGGRGNKSDSRAMVGLWADIDIADEKHHKKGNLPKTQEEAQSVIDNMNLEPTIVIHSGHGLQAWWLFKEPWDLGNPDGTLNDKEYREATLLAERFIYTMQQRAQFEVDSVQDLTRVLRVAGTENCKDPKDKRPVKIIHFNDNARYNIDDFEEILLDMAIKTPGPLVEADEIESLDLNPNAMPDLIKIDLLREADPVFDATWRRARKDFSDDSQSTYDLSLATQLFSIGDDYWTDQNVVDVLIYHRRKTDGGKIEKTLRQDYYARTLAKAKNTARKAQAVKLLEELEDVKLPKTTDTSTVPGEETRQDKRQRTDVEQYRRAIIDSLNAVLEVDIVRLIKYMSDPPTYELVTERGRIRLPSVNHIIVQQKFREAVATVANVYISSFKKAEWEKIAQKLLDVCEEQNAGDESTYEGLAREIISRFLEERVVTDDRNKGLNEGIAYIEDGHYWIPAPNFREWLQNVGYKFKRTELGPLLKAYGCEERRGIPYKKPSGQTTTKNAWRIPRSKHMPPTVEKDEE